MKNDYPRRKSGNPIMSLLGFIFAIILFVGWMKNNGFNIARDNPDTELHYASAGIVGGAVDERPEATTDIELRSAHAGDYDARRYDNAANYRSQSDQRPRASHAVRSSVDAGDWIAEFSSVAVSQAVSRGVPAAISLAVGLQQIEQGARILSWGDFVDQVVEPLARTKHRASAQDRSAYFKYSANSGLWAEGLDALGKYRERELTDLIRSYSLAQYDRQVKEAVVSGKKVDAVTAERAEYVAEEVTSVRRRRTAEEPYREHTAISGRAADNVRIAEEEDYYDEFVGREVAREIAKEKIKSGKYIDESDMDRLIDETNRQTEQVIQNKITFLGRNVNRKHPDAAKKLDITKPENDAAREELYQRKLRENRLDSRSRRKHKN